MNFFIVLSAFLYIFLVLAIDAENQLGDQILLRLKKWRKKNIQNKLLTIPFLKFFNLNGVENHFRGNGIDVFFTIGDMKLTGLDSFYVQKFDIKHIEDCLEISAMIIVPTVNLHSDDYKLTGWAYYFFPLHGYGTMTIAARNSHITLDIRFANVSNNSISMDYFALRYSIGIVEANLGNSSWPITDVLNNGGAKIFESYNEEFNQVIRCYAKSYTIKYLSNITFKDFADSL